MELLADVPKTGFGNTNDGDPPLGVFADLGTFSWVTRIDIDH